MPLKKPSNAKELADLYDAAESLQKKMEAIRLDYKTKKAAVENEFAPLLNTLSPSERKKIEPGLQEAKSRKLADFRKATQVSRDIAMRQLNEIRAWVKEVTPHLADPRKTAQLHAIGSEERSRIEQTASAMKPAALKALATQGELVGGKEGKLMVAVAISYNDALDKNDRQFDSRELAYRVWADEVENIKNNSLAIENLADQIGAINKDIDGGTITGTDKIAAGLRHGRESRLLPPDLPSGERSMSAVDKIEAGLREDGSIAA